MRFEGKTALVTGGAKGIGAATASTNCSKDTPIRWAVCSVIAVAMKPGATQLTLTLNGPSSIASVFVIPCRPAFAVE